MKKVATASAALVLFLFFGGIWTSLVQFLPDGIPRGVVLVGMALLFAGTFVWLLAQRVRVILGGSDHVVRHSVVTGLLVLLLITAFASVYQKLGIVDTTQPDSPVVHSFWSTLYFSVVTFTTLGYGDFQPQGLGRALAGIQALTGYLVLGILASTAASALTPDGEDEE